VVLARWWQITLGAALGAMVGVYMPPLAFVIAIVLGLLLAWSGLTNDGDDALTATAAGYLTGVLGYGLIHVAAIVFDAPFA